MRGPDPTMKRVLKRLYAWLQPVVVLCIRILAPLRRIGLKNRDFSIISNNCWGGIVTRRYGLPYRSPTCGLYFFSKEYLRFLQDLPAHLEAELQPVEPGASRYAEEIRLLHGDHVVVGRALDAEIVFLHYASFEEAKATWDRRKKRVNYDNLLVKYNDQNGFAEGDYEAFAALPYRHKVFFTANEHLAGKPDTVFFRRYREEGYVIDDIKTSGRYFHLKKYLNDMKK